MGLAVDRLTRADGSYLDDSFWRGRARMRLDDELDATYPQAAAVRRRRPRPGVAPDVLAAVAAGGALGAPARYGLAQVVGTTAGGFPWATFWTNVSGSLALGFVLVLVTERFPPTRSRYLRPFFAVGFLGAYTTFSTFAVDVDLLVKDGHATTALAYVVASLVGGFAAVTAGIVLGRRVGRRAGGSAGG
jgi:CrcB protein